MPPPSEQSPVIIHFNQLRNIPVPIQALCEAGLSPTQWIMLFILHFRKELQPEYLAMFNCENKSLLWTEDEIEDIFKRKYLRRNPVQIEELKSSDAANIHTTKRFTDLLSTLKEAWLPNGHYQLSRPLAEHPLHLTAAKPVSPAVAPVACKLEVLDAFDELFRTYPRHIPVNGILMSCWNGDYCIMAASYESYLASKGALEHKRILDIVRWAKEQNLLTMRLHKFIDSHGWLGLQKLWDQSFAGSSRK